MRVLDEKSSTTICDISPLETLQFPGVLDQSFKTAKSAHYIVPFLLKVYNLEETAVTKSIEKCITELDNLAIRVDSILDQEKLSISIKDYNLEFLVKECLDTIQNLPAYEEILKDTLECVSLSFAHNTTDREVIYSFDEDFSVSKCTTWYLFPLVKYLTSLSPISLDISKTFPLVANYIQLIDDFVDVFEDMELAIYTPVTRYFQHCINTSENYPHAFTQLVQAVKIKAQKHLDELRREALNKNKELDCEVFNEWYEFLRALEISTNTRGNEREFVKRLKQVLPPIISYTNA